MRTPATHRLSFLLPPGVAFGGRCPPSRFPCIVDAKFAPLIAIVGWSRGAVFDQAALLLAEACRGIGQLTIAASLQSDGAYDGWSIILNAEVAFAPTALGAEFPFALQGAVLVGAGAACR